MSLDLKSVALFVRVASLGAMARAGEEFGFSPTTTSQRIQALERDLGVTLFARTTRSVSLTHDGERFLSHAKTILTQVDDARQDLLGSDRAIKGVLRVTASATFGHRFISPHISEFIGRHPDVQIHLNLTDSIVDIVEQGYDLSLRIGTLASSTLIAQKFADNPRSLVAAPEYIERFGRPDTVKALAAHNCIFQGTTRHWRFKSPSGQTDGTNVSGNFDCNDGDAIRDAIVGGTGIGLRSDWSIAQELATGALVRLLPDFQVQPVWKIWAVRPPGLSMPARVRVFLDYLKAKYRDAQTESSKHSQTQR